MKRVTGLFLITLFFSSQISFAAQTEAGTCEALKKTYDVYKTFVFAQQIGVATAENFHGLMYRNINDTVNKYIDQKCSTMNSKDLVENADFTCKDACLNNAAQVEKNEKKKNAMAAECSKICDINYNSQLKFLDGMALAAGKNSSDCVNPSKDAISNIDRAIKNVPKDEKGVLKTTIVPK